MAWQWLVGNYKLQLSGTFNGLIFKFMDLHGVNVRSVCPQYYLGPYGFNLPGIKLVCT